MQTSRRTFLAMAGALAAAGAGYRGLANAKDSGPLTPSRYGPLTPDPDGLLDLPEGFSYRVISRTGAPMADGFRTPARHDGMACFPDPENPRHCILVRNHEIDEPSGRAGGPFVDDDIGDLDPALVFDTDARGRPFGGGTTTQVYDLDSGESVSEFLSLAGTANNCAGGPTPWGSWLTCEETEIDPGRAARKAHGFVFEVPAAAKGPVTPVPLTAMGRFKHEAAAVDPETGIVYMTEDQHDGLIYRFLPNTPGVLADGGRLQALMVRGRPQADLRNWPGQERGAAVGAPIEVTWIDLDEVEAPKNDLRLRGALAGAAVFARGEGMGYAAGPDGASVYFACTNGGPKRIGQIWQYRPAGGADGSLELVYESTAALDMEKCDNLVAAPEGYLVICEDGDAEQYLRIMETDGHMGTFARNAHPRRSEFCGACFSPDGSTMFVNIQKPGLTLAITGPWRA